MWWNFPPQGHVSGASSETHQLDVECLPLYCLLATFRYFGGKSPALRGFKRLPRGTEVCFDNFSCNYKGICTSSQRTLISFTGNCASIGSVSRLLNAYLLEDGAYGWLEYFYINPPSEKETLVNIFQELDSLLHSTAGKISRGKKSTHSIREMNYHYARYAAMKTPKLLNNTWSTANVFCKSKQCNNLANFPQTTRSDSSTNNCATKGKQQNNSGVECRLCVLCASKNTEEHALGINYGALCFGGPIYPMWRGHRFAKCMVMSPRRGTK